MDTKQQVFEARHFVRALLFASLLLATALLISARTTTEQPQSRRGAAGAQATLARLPLSFEPNRGQTDGQVRFLARGSGYSLFLTPGEAVLSLRRAAAPSGAPAASAVLRMKLVGASPRPRITGAERLPGTSSYFLGSDPQAWRTGVPHFGKVRYGGVYPGIDLVYYGIDQRRLEYDFVVAPGADPGQVRLAFSGARCMELDGAGELVLRTPGGELRQHRPVVYQEVRGERRAVAGSYRLLARNEVGFQVGSYDRSRPLVIDPVLSYSTYLGCGGAEEARAVALDAAGAIYLTGSTASVDFPSGRAYGGGTDAFVVKVSPKGDQVEYSSYLGGSGTDMGTALAVDGTGSAFLTGETGSANFPRQSPIQSTFGGHSDAFVARLAADGATLVYSTYLGGPGQDYGCGIALDSSGSAHVAGCSNSPGLPSLRPFGGGTHDAFVAKVKPDGTGLLYFTYLGGSGSDVGSAVAIESGSAYVAGFTTSTDFPTLSAAMPTARGSIDAFVMRLGATGAIGYSTYLGGTADDRAYGIAVAFGRAYVTGGTTSTNFPTGADPWRLHSGGEDAFLTRLSQFGSAIAESTYIGGSGDDAGTAVALFVNTRTSDVYASVAGRTQSADLYVSDGSTPRGGPDAFITRFNATGNVASFSTYLGGGGTDVALGLAVSRETGAHYVAGWTASQDFPLAKPLQPVLTGPTDAFVARYAIAPPTNLIALPLAPPVAGTATGVRLTWSDNSDEESGFEIWRRLPEGEWEARARTVRDATSWEDTSNVAPDTTYRVRAYSDPDFSDWSNEARVIRPAAPTITGTIAAGDKVRISYRDNTTRELARSTAFEIWRKPCNEKDYVLAGTQSATLGLVYEDTVPAVNETYTYRVRTVFGNTGSEDYKSEFSDPANVITLGGPEILVERAVGSSQVFLKWADNARDEAGYYLWRAASPAAANANVPPDFVPNGAWGPDTNGDGLPDPYKTLSTPNLTTYVDATGGDTLYWYRIQAFKGTSVSAMSVIPAGVNTLNAPSSLTVTALLPAGQATVSWRDNSTREGNHDNAAAPVQTGVEGTPGFVVERRKAGDTAFTEVKRLPTTGRILRDAAGAPIGWENQAGATLSYTDVGLADTTYEYRVRAINDTGFGSDPALAVLNASHSEPSNVVTRLMLPATPTGLAAVRVDRSAPTDAHGSLAWVNVSTSATSLRIERSAGGAGSFTTLTSGLAPTTAAFTDVGPLDDITTYFYRVVAVNATGSSAPSSPASFKTLGNPDLLTAAAAVPSQITLAWNDNSRDEVSWSIERKPNAGGADAFGEIIAGLAKDTRTFRDFNVQPGGTYTYRVRARNRHGEFTSFSQLATSTVAGLGKPSGVTATPVFSRTVSLTWSSSSTGAKGFHIERSSGVDGTVLVATVPAGTNAYTDGSLPNGFTSYTYRIRAFNDDTTGEWVSSNSVVPFTRAAPTGLTATPTTVGGPVVNGVVVPAPATRLDWSYDGSTNTGFVILKTTGAGTVTAISVGGKGARSYVDGAYSPDARYQIKAVSQSGDESDLSTMALTVQP